MPWGTTWRSTRVGQEAEEVREKYVQEPLLWFPQEVMDKDGSTSLGLACLNNSMFLIVWHLALGNRTDG